MRNYISKVSLLDSVLFLFIFFLYYYGLGSYGLLNNNEGLYAEIPREMVETGQYVIPYLNGVPYIEKPPLLYWLIAFGYTIGGVSETTARLVPATAGVAINVLTYFFARTTISLQVARLGVLILSTMGGLVVFSRMVFFDVLLTLFLTGSLFLFFRWHQTHQKMHLRLFYVVLAFAVMTKGLVALGLTVLVSVVFLFVTKNDRGGRIREFLDPWGMIFFLALVMPWHVAAGFQEKQFTWFYFINEHFLRFLGLRIPKDYYYGPLYYYLPRLFLTMLPWSFMLPLIFKKSSSDKPLITFLWVWILVFFSFFSLSQAKANYYLVTIFPALALLLAIKLAAFSRIKRIKQARQIGAVFLTFVLPCVGLLAICVRSSLPLEVQPLVTVLPVGFFWGWLGCSIGIMAICARFFKRLPFWPEVLIALQMPFLLICSLVMAQRTEPLFSARKFMQEIPCEASSIVLYRDFEKISSVRFYARRHLPLVNSLSNDLHFGLHTSQGSSLDLSPEKFQRLLSQQEVCVIVFHEQKTNFEKTYPDARLIHQKERIYLYKITATK
ncbi:MAG: glycosyltransferase family 39 protein [Caedimonas sp.]|nr:glycosyltransferase family 39 protein [Caedimonas sp.]